MTDPISPTVTPPATPIATPPAAVVATPGGAPAPAPKRKPFVPINPPPSDHHGLNVGLSTELGDSAKTAFEKINAGFEHVYSLLTGMPNAVKQVEAKASGPVSTWINDFESRLKNIEDMLHNAKNPAPQITTPTAAVAAATASSPAKS